MLNSSDNEFIPSLEEGNLPDVSEGYYDKRKGLPQLFPKGTSGNPNGRPKGVKNRKTILQERVDSALSLIILRDAPKVLRKVISMALEGDTVCLKILMDRLMPAKKAIEVTGKDGKDFGIKIIVENLVTHEVKSLQQEEDEDNIEDAEYEELETVSGPQRSESV